MYAIDVVNALHAKALILTPKLKRQMAERRLTACAAPYLSTKHLELLLQPTTLSV
jgi:hypothetical protein